MLHHCAPNLYDRLFESVIDLLSTYICVPDPATFKFYFQGLVCHIEIARVLQWTGGGQVELLLRALLAFICGCLSEWRTGSVVGN